MWWFTWNRRRIQKTKDGFEARSRIRLLFLIPPDPAPSPHWGEGGDEGSILIHFIPSPPFSLRQKSVFPSPSPIWI